MGERNEGPSFSVRENNQIYVEDIIKVFEEQLKVGLHKGASILLSHEDCNQFDYSGFSALRPLRQGLVCARLILRVRAGR